MSLILSFNCIQYKAKGLILLGFNDIEEDMKG